MSNLKSEISKLTDLVEKSANLTDLIAELTSLFPEEISFSTSFSEEDQIIYHFIAQSKSQIIIFTLDTGRLFPETYSTWSRTLEKYNLPIKAYYPDAIVIQNFIETNGPNSFYQSIENRKECCRIRKVEPLKRALTGKKIWITGIRAEHSPDRSHMPAVEWDETHQVIKIHPLLHWSLDQVKTEIKKNDIPYNPLHEKGFVSIGCAPCTRAIKTGEDFRAGRWWWEDASKKECGLHIHAESK